MYFMFLDQFLFELLCKKKHRTNTDTHRDSDEYSIVEFSKNATIITQKVFQTYLGADHLIPGGGGLWFFCEKKDCSANFGK